tara:strand:+ start:16 stop:699 length:684 start_codon:yes stop_codon:yes gene_type:complete
MRVLIAHYPKLTARLENILSSMKSAKFDMSNVMVSNGICRSKITDSIFSQYVINNSEELGSYFQALGSIAPPLNRERPAFLANFLNHQKIWKNIAAENQDYTLVLEDDAILSHNFDKLWPTLIKSIPKDLDIAYLNAGCGLTPDKFGVKLSPDILWYKMPHKRSRTCCAYLIRKSCASQLASIPKFALHVDWEMSYYHIVNKHNVYWTNPAPFIEGSAEKIYDSSVR